MDQQTPLVCPSRTTQFIGAVLVGIIIGTGASFAYLNQPITPTGDRYQEGFDAAKKRIESYGPAQMLFRENNSPVQMLGGTIASVSGGTLTLKVGALEPFADESLDTRTVTISSSAKIYSFVPKDAKVLQAENTAWQKTMDENIKAKNPKPIGMLLSTRPEPSVRTEVGRSTLVVGKNITVKTDHDVKKEKSFVATEVIINN